MDEQQPQESKWRAAIRLRGGSLARQILLALAALAFVPLLIMAMQGLHCARQAILELEETHLQAVIIARKTHLEAWLGEREQELRTLAGLTCGQEGCAGLLRQHSPEHSKWVARTLNSVGPVYESLVLYAADWSRITRREGSSHDDQDLLDPMLRARLTEATGLVVLPTHHHANGHPGLHIGLPIRNQDGLPDGYLVANLHLEETLTRIMEQRAGLGRSGKVYLVSVQNRYISDVRPGLNRIGQPAGLPADMMNATTMAVRMYRDATGARVLGCVAAVPQLQWFLVAEIDEKEALGWLHRLAHRALITGAVVFAGVVLVALRLARRLGEPLRLLAGTARRITEGSHRERVGTLRGAEAQDVGRAFDEMLDALERAQRTLVQSTSLAAIGELSASLAHEMRNPLSSIKLNLQALRKRVKGDGSYEELAEIASAQTQRLERMLTELLQYAKPRTLKATPVKFGDLAAAATEAVRGAAEAKHVALQTVDELRDQALLGDFEQLLRAVTNLLQNAVEASDAGTVVTLQGKPSDKDGGVMLLVNDHGPGVPAALVERLFQPFVTTREQGTGLGLANVRKIVELHEGCVAFRNLDAGGACFWIELPPLGARP